jgi:hypothetical protein
MCSIPGRGGWLEEQIAPWISHSVTMRKASVATWLVLTGCLLLSSAPARADGGTALRFGQSSYASGEHAVGRSDVLVRGKTPEPTLGPLTTTNDGMSWKVLASIGAAVLLVAAGLGLAIGLVDDRVTRHDIEDTAPDPGDLDATGLDLP